MRDKFGDDLIIFFYLFDLNSASFKSILILSSSNFSLASLFNIFPDGNFNFWELIFSPFLITSFGLSCSLNFRSQLALARNPGPKFRFVFKIENFKMVSGEYDVEISSKGIARFSRNKLQYWIATESSSNYGG